MVIPQTILLGILGIPLILVGANMIVKYGRILALKMRISGVFIGLTLVSIGTSIPEIVTHILAASKITVEPELANTLAGVAIGTDLGSNIVQITAIVGLVGLMGKIRTTKEFMYRDYMFMLVGILAVWFFSWTGNYLSRWEGIVLMLSYAGYLYYLADQEEVDEKLHDGRKPTPWGSAMMVIFGMVVVVLSAEMILDAAVFAADYFQISGSMIGALIIGVATALPELTTAIVGLRQKADGIAVGTLIGSNITNPLLGIGLGATIAQYPVGSEILRVDLPFWFFISALGWIFFRTQNRVTRWQAGILFLSYPVYLYLRLYVA